MNQKRVNSISSGILDTLQVNNDQFKQLNFERQLAYQPKIEQSILEFRGACSAGLAISYDRDRKRRLDGRFEQHGLAHLNACSELIRLMMEKYQYEAITQSIEFERLWNPIHNSVRARWSGIVETLSEFDDLWLRIIRLLDIGLNDGLKLMDSKMLWNTLLKCLSNPDLWFRADVECQLGESAAGGSTGKSLGAEARRFQDFRLKNTIFVESTDSSSGTSFSQMHTNAQMGLREQLATIEKGISTFYDEANTISGVFQDLNRECCQLAALFRERSKEPIKRLKKEEGRQEADIAVKEAETRKFIEEGMTSVGERVKRNAPWVLSPFFAVHMFNEGRNLVAEAAEAYDRKQEVESLKRLGENTRADIDKVNKLAEEMYQKGTELGSYLKRYSVWFQFIVDDAILLKSDWSTFRSTLGKLVQLGDCLDLKKKEAAAKAEWEKATRWCRGMKLDKTTLNDINWEDDGKGGYVKKEEEVVKNETIYLGEKADGESSDESLEFDPETIRGQTQEQKLLLKVLKDNVEELASSAAGFVETGANFYLNRALFEKMG